MRRPCATAPSCGLLFDLGLRRAEVCRLDVEDLDTDGAALGLLGAGRAEVCRLDVEDLDQDGAALWILGRGRSQKERLPLPRPTRAALASWLALRGTEPGALFHRLDRAGKGKGRLTGAAVYAVVRQLGEGAGIRARPHGLRHAAITEALDLTGGDVRQVQRFSRHRNLNTLQRYDDNRQDLAGDVARRLAEATGREAA